MTAKQQAQQIHAILTCNESAEMQPPFRRLPIGSSEWLAEKVRRIAALVQQAVQTTKKQDARIAVRLWKECHREHWHDRLKCNHGKLIAAALRGQEPRP